MRALVTGAAGFVGRHLIPELGKRYDIVALDPKDPYFPERFEDWRYRTALNPEESQFDVVVHLGANIQSIDDRVKGKLDCYDDLVLDYEVCRFVEEFPPSKCFVAMSSCAAQFPAEEDPYSFVKQALEKFCSRLHKQGVPVAILRPFSGYGAGQNESYPFPAITQRALNHEDPLTVWGSAETVRDWLHISDLVKAILWAIENPLGVPVQIGTGRGVTFGEFARLMADAVGYRPEVKALSDKAAGCLWRVADTALAKASGWEAKVSLDDGIRREIEAYQAALAGSRG